MKTLIGGSVAAVVGLIGLGIFWRDFFALLAGAIPIILLAGGGLAIYLGFDELKDSWKKDDDSAAASSEEPEKYKQEIDDLKKEIETLKSEKA
jgi:cell division protein FtsB